MKSIFKSVKLRIDVEKAKCFLIWLKRLGREFQLIAKLYFSDCTCKYSTCVLGSVCFPVDLPADKDSLINLL